MPVPWVDLTGLSSAYESFLAGGTVKAEVRSRILASWQRSKFFGVEPDRLEIPYQEELDLEGRLNRAAGPVLEQLESTVSATKTNVSVILSDEHGRVLQRRAGDRKLNTSLDAVQLAVGFTFAEPIAGTNGIGTALAERQPCYILGREHFAQGMEPFACAGAPVRNPLSGHIEGVLDLTCWRTDADPTMLNTVSRAAAEIEKRLIEQATEGERELLRAFLRTRHHDRLPVGPPVSGRGTLGIPPSIGEVLERSDHALLREKAAELISSPQRVTMEVRLSCGQVATLRCRPVTGLSGQMGIAVEATLSGNGLRGRIARTATAVPSAPDSLLVSTDRLTPRRLRPPRAAPVSSEAAAPARDSFAPNLPVPPVPAGSAQAPPAPVSSTDEWLLLLGEPGVGRLAVQARQRLALLFSAGTRIGTTLDVRRTAEELAEVAVPQLADFAAVDLMEPVLHGEEPELAHDELRRVAMSGVREDSHLYAVGELVDFVPSTPQARSLAHRESVLEPVLAEAPGWIAQDPARGAKILGSGIHSLITVPMQARGVLLGVVSFLRSQCPDPFDDDDLSLAEELVGRAALCIDNARRYAREHTLALGLQRSLLPQGLRSQSAVEVAHRYLPSRAGVGGDWYDVIPLSGARVALVVGDVVGHGVHAAATMGRLQTAVYNFSSLDLPADELLTRLDALVDRLDAVQDMAGTDRSVGSGVVGATCLYAVYDPVSRHCVLARAGHPLPALVLPDGTVEFPEVPAGPPLGLCSLPFETLELEIPEGSELVLYSDGLIEDRNRDIDVGLALLQRALSQPSRPPEETCDAVLDALLPARPSDDVALLVARFRSLDAGQVAVWDLPHDPASVSGIRATVTEQLRRWGLQELVFATELLVSELVTNAIRHAVGPIQVRLLRDRALICEVSDGSSTSPRMRQAATTDENGRGLFMAAQLATRWGTRYTNSGKVIWTEQTLP